MSVPGREHASQMHMQSGRCGWLGVMASKRIAQKRKKKKKTHTHTEDLRGSVYNLSCVQCWLLFMCLLCEIAAYILTVVQWLALLPNSKEVLGGFESWLRPFCAEFTCSPWVLPWVFSGYSGFLQQSKNMLVK